MWKGEILRPIKVQVSRGLAWKVTCIKNAPIPSVGWIRSYQLRTAIESVSPEPGVSKMPSLWSQLSVFTTVESEKSGSIGILGICSYIPPDG